MKIDTFADINSKKLDVNKGMKNILFPTILLLLALVGCSKDDDASIEFEHMGLFVENPGESFTTKFSCSNVTSLSVYSQPTNWDIAISMSDKTLTVTAPSNPSSSSESLVLFAYSEDGDSVYASLEIGVVPFVALDDPDNDLQANSFVLTEGNTFYTFNPNRRGESTEEESTKATDCEILWSTDPNPIKYLRMMDDGSIGFFAHTSFDYGFKFVDGNVVIAGLNSKGQVLWSWHIWTVYNEITDVQVGNTTFMDRNLGAPKNNNSTDGYIYNSYGLYYQWGRKDPFIYPDTYNAAYGLDESIYDEDGEEVYIDYELTKSKYGTISYTTLHPLTYLTSEESLNYDWLAASQKDDNLWSEDGKKSIYDPSPKGYRVPTSAELSQLQVDTSAELGAEDYGRYLSGELFMALGYRTFYTGLVQNVAEDGSFTPWAGYYWSSDAASDGGAYALYFDMGDEATVTSRYRANGMQIRCVKE